MSWDNEKVLSFIKEYEMRPILWKKDDKLYHNLVKKEDAWREVGAIIGEDPDDLKKKMESLRGSRRREKNRVVNSLRTRKGRKGIYVSRWFAWESLKFLDDELRPSSTNYPALENAENEDDNVGNFEQNSDEDNKHDEDLQRDPNPAEIRNASRKRFGSSMKPELRKYIEFPRVVEEEQNILESKATTERKDECAMFGDFIAEKLRKLERRQRAMLQHEIHNLLFQAEMATPHTS